LIKNCWDENSKKRPSFSDIHRLMDEIILECVLPSAEGRTFWKTKFGTRDSVNTQNFFESITSYYGESHEIALNFIFEENTKVSLEDLGNAVKWFGDIPNTFFKNITYLYEKNWYHHTMNQRLTNTLMATKKDGWLVRLGNSPGVFELITSKENFKVVLDGNNLRFKKRSYKSWEEFINAEKDNMRINLSDAIVSIKH